MDKNLLHVIIAEIARGAIDIGKINKSDLLSYNKRIDDLAASIYMYAAQLHNEFFLNGEEGVNDAETQDS